MKKEYQLAVDLGTQSVRALVFSKTGELIAKSQVMFHPIYNSPHPGWAEQDPEYYWNCTTEACSSLMRDSGINKDSIAAITITTQRATLINLDKEGKLLRPAILWLDQRRAGKLPRLPFPWNIIFMAPVLRGLLYYFQSEAEANWIREKEETIWEKTEHFLLVSGYLAYKFTGRYVDSVGCQVGFLPFDYKNQRWSESSSWKKKAVPIPDKMLPELVPPGEIMGSITDKAALACGLPAGLPLVAGASDKACEVLGSGCLELNQGCIGYGTTATINVNSKKYIEPVRLLPPYPSGVKGAYNLEIQIFRGFWMVKWFKEQFAHSEQQSALEDGIETEEILSNQAADVPPGSMGLILQPYWSPGVRNPGAEAKGGIIGFGSVHEKRHVYRAILEGLAYALREGKEKIEKRTGTNIEDVRICGGGSKSDLVMQITSDIFNLPVKKMAVYESSGLGAAILGTLGSGVYPDVKTAVAKMTNVDKIFYPDEKSSLIYDKLYKKSYLKMYGKLKPLYKDIMKITGYPHGRS